MFWLSASCLCVCKI